tara:strand:+ start:1313 stop:2791 length:1479 start_codon:yes stop_codon:yes gene_type:complete
MKKIIILGGGAAGWLTALFAKKVFPQNSIHLIESTKIGILGAGEGSTPHLINFFQYLDINVWDLISKTKGTIKFGINFENWNGDGKKYFHNFASHNRLDSFKIKNTFDEGCYQKYLINCCSKNLNLNEYLYGSLLAENKKVDIENESFSLHFDAHKIANYLKEISKSRGVIHTEGDLKNLKQDHNGNVKEIILQDNTKYECDFIFDCSGFKRLIIGNLYKTHWIDYQPHLPMKKAIPFFLDQEEEIAPCTHAVAMKYGWMWKIPLQHRFGAGYIYDSNYIDSEQALEEAESLLKRKLNSPRVISFEAGRFEKVWVKNCIAVGLSAGFTEPLEATSLFLTAQQLFTLAHYKDSLFDSSDFQKNSFNEIMGNSNDDVLAFLYLHYMTKRKDSDFWINFKNNTTPPKKLKERLLHLKESNFIPHNFDLHKCVAGFDLGNYIVVSYGLGLLNTNTIKPILELSPKVGEYKSMMLHSLDRLNLHKSFLKGLDAPNIN